LRTATEGPFSTSGFTSIKTLGFVTFISPPRDALGRTQPTTHCNMYFVHYSEF
jgi:hypothetical protein